MAKTQITKKYLLSYGIYLMVLVLLCSLLSGCQRAKQNAEANNSDSRLQIDSSISPVEEQQDLEKETETEKTQTDEVSGESEESELVSNADESKEMITTEFTVESGAYLTEILQDLVECGWGESVDSWLIRLDQMNRAEYQYWSLIENAEERAFAAEGYIAPGQYEWESTASNEEVLNQLMSSWDRVFTAEMVEQAQQQGYTVDDVLIMASIVEWESSFDPYNIVKPQVAAVVRNRIESETALQMDVTIFYLQESLEPYRDPAMYESNYDTYIRSTLPAGPIGSPSIDSIQAVLNPADTEDLFFVYDEEGNYYFAEDYDQHLVNCDLAGIY